MFQPKFHESGRLESRIASYFVSQIFKETLQYSVKRISRSKKKFNHRMVVKTRLRLVSLMTAATIVLSAKIDTTLLVGHFTAISGHFFANYVNMFQKTEVLTVILRCLTCLNLNLIKNYYINHKCF